jgi:hypothetical protein
VRSRGSALSKIARIKVPFLGGGYGSKICIKLKRW